MTVLQEKLARLDIIVLLTVPAVNALLAKKMKLKILVRALPVRQQRAARKLLNCHKLLLVRMHRV